MSPHRTAMGRTQSWARGKWHCLPGWTTGLIVTMWGELPGRGWPGPFLLGISQGVHGLCPFLLSILERNAAPNCLTSGKLCNL